MPRRIRCEYPGATYHVTTRGVDGEFVFRDTFDRRQFLVRLRNIVQRYGWRCLAYCLMGTHYHLLVTTPQPNLAAGMQHLNGGYAQAFNRFHARRGHLFGARYGAAEVGSDAHVLAAVRYVVQNPVRAGICDLPEEWRWSSHRATSGLIPVPSFLAAADLLVRFSPRPALAQASYRAFVGDPVETVPSGHSYYSGAASTLSA